MTQFLVMLAVSTAVLGLCLFRPAAGRVVVGGLFLVMAVAVNVVLALTAPELFVALGTDAPLVPLYAWTFEHVVALAPAAFGLAAAAYEIAVAALVLSRGRRVALGLWGGIAFLLTITPLGVWTLANPVLALALALLLRRTWDVGVVEALRARLAPTRQGKGA